MSESQHIHAYEARLFRGFWAQLTRQFYCGRCDSCGEAGCQCGLRCDRGAFCMYPGIKEESEEWRDSELNPAHSEV